MNYDFIKYDSILTEFKVYTSNIDYEKIFCEVPNDIHKDIFDLTNLYYDFFETELKVENTASISVILNSTKKIDKIPVKAHLVILKNLKYVDTQTGEQKITNKISVNVCLHPYEHVSNNFEVLQNIFLLDFDIDNEPEFKKYLYNIIFYAYIIFKDFKYHPMLKYLNHKDEIDSIVKLKTSFIRLFGESDDCSVCLEQTIYTTTCNHYLCQKCFSQLREKICPSCRTDLIEENNFTYEDVIDIDY